MKVVLRQPERLAAAGAVSSRAERCAIAAGTRSRGRASSAANGSADIRNPRRESGRCERVSSDVEGVLGLRRLVYASGISNGSAPSAYNLFHLLFTANAESVATTALYESGRRDLTRPARSSTTRSPEPHATL